MSSMPSRVAGRSPSSHHSCRTSATCTTAPDTHSVGVPAWAFKSSTDAVSALLAVPRVLWAASKHTNARVGFANAAWTKARREVSLAAAPAPWPPALQVATTLHVRSNTSCLLGPAHSTLVCLIATPAHSTLVCLIPTPCSQHSGVPDPYPLLT
eukprot:365676-Chlamydomonas_euryale.AAC.9